MNIDTAAKQMESGTAAGAQSGRELRSGAVRQAGWLLELERALLALGREGGRDPVVSRHAPAAAGNGGYRQSDGSGRVSRAAKGRPAPGAAMMLAVRGSTGPGAGHAPQGDGPSTTVQMQAANASPTDGRTDRDKDAAAPASNFSPLRTANASAATAASDAVSSKAEETSWLRPGTSRNAAALQGALIPAFSFASRSAVAGGADMPQMQAITDGPQAMQIRAVARLPGVASSMAAPFAVEAHPQAVDIGDAGASVASDAMPEADGRTLAAPSSPLIGEAYARHHLHLLHGKDGMHAWIRDAGLSAMQAAAVLQALRSELHGAGIKLGMVTLNGRPVALRPQDVAEPSSGGDISPRSPIAAAGWSSQFIYRGGIAYGE